jgi:hypothetical protein
MLWVHLSSDVIQYYKNGRGEVELFLPAIYEYFRWCIQSTDVDTYNAACVGFAEDLAALAMQSEETIYGHIVGDIAATFDHLEIRKLAPCFAIPLGPARIGKFLTDIAKTQRDHPKLLKSRRGKRKAKGE